MLILSDVSENVSQNTTNFTVDLTSIVLAALSVVLCFAALIVAIIVARRDAMNRFESVVEECLAPKAIFIQDIFVIRSVKKYRGILYINEGDNKRVEGLHRLRVFAITNGYNLLEEATKIHVNSTEKENDPNDKILSFCLLILENSYMEFRRNHRTGNVSQIEMVVLDGYSVLFQNYLKLVSKYMFNFMDKKKNKNSDDYYNELKEIHTGAQTLCLKTKELEEKQKNAAKQAKKVSKKMLGS